MESKIKIHRTINGLLLGLLAGLLFIPTACNKTEEDVKPSEAPEIPPESTFAIDFSDFSNADTTGYKSTQTYQNWWWAASHVLAWNTVLTVTFAVPVAAFRESFNHAPVYDPDNGNWIWSYNFIAQGTVHLAELHGKVENDTVTWEMYISKANAFSGFLWYYGIASISNKAGEWHVNENPNNPGEIIKIVWHRNPAAGEADIKYINVKENAPENGAYIYYGVNTDPAFNAFYNIYSAQNDNLTDIMWHRTDKNGRVMDEIHFGDTNWHCWDENLMDITCP